LSRFPAIPDETASPRRGDVPEDQRAIAVLHAAAASGSVAFGLALPLRSLGQPPVGPPGGGAGFGQPAVRRQRRGHIAQDQTDDRPHRINPTMPRPARSGYARCPVSSFGAPAGRLDYIKAEAGNGPASRHLFPTQGVSMDDVTRRTAAQWT